MKTKLNKRLFDISLKVYKQLLANDIVPITPNNENKTIKIPEHWLKKEIDDRIISNKNIKLKMTKYFKLTSTVSNLEIYVKVDEWNGDKIVYYPSYTLYNGTIIYCIENDKHIIKKVFDRKYLSINNVTIETEINENEWNDVINDL